MYLWSSLRGAKICERIRSETRKQCRLFFLYFFRSLSKFAHQRTHLDVSRARYRGRFTATDKRDRIARRCSDTLDGPDDRQDIHSTLSSWMYWLLTFYTNQHAGCSVAAKSTTSGDARSRNKKYDRRQVPRNDINTKCYYKTQAAFYKSDSQFEIVIGWNRWFAFCYLEKHQSLVSIINNYNS